MVEEAGDPDGPEYPLEELASLPALFHPAASPSGDRVAYYYDVTGRNELYVLDVDTGEQRRISDGEVPRDAKWRFRWDATGDRVYFHRDDAGDEQHDVHALPLEGDRETVLETDGQAHIVEPSPDGRYLLYASDEREQLNLRRYDTETGEREQLTAYDQPVWGGSYAPDGDRIAYPANETDDLDNTDVYVASAEPRSAANADGSNHRRLAFGDLGAEENVADWHPDGDRLLVFDNSEDTPRAGIYDLSDDAVDWLGDDAAVEIPEVFTPDGDGVVVLRKRRAAAVPVFYDLETGESRELELPEGVASVPPSHAEAFLADGRLLLTQSTPTERSRLLAYDLSTDEVDALLDADYGDIDPAAFVDAEYVTYESPDGTEIGGLLWDARRRPSADSDATDRPGLVKVHGGPHFQSDKRFDEYAQFFVSRGYTVFAPNYRGSTGRGREFKHAVRGDWGGAEAEDIAEAGRWLMDREWIDEDRVAVFGASYGGYSTYTQLTRYPGLWATGMAWVGMTDLESLYEESMPHYRTMLEQQLGDPEEHADLYRERSPVTHVDQLEDPILITHGVTDPRCPIDQARRFRDALEDRGWEAGADFRYEELGEEGHGSTDTDKKIRAYRIMAEYLDEHL